MNIVKESLDFEREGTPFKKLNIGVKKSIENWLENHNIYNYVINEEENNYIYSKQNIFLHLCNLVKLPDYIQFFIVDGTFTIHRNKLISLKGCPINVLGSFSCHNNKLKSLDGCPELVKENFSCNDNLLTSLDGCPKLVGGNFYCKNNKVKFTRKDVLARCKVKGSISV
ncbi:MAG: hypothetical protein PHF86_02550 [Candidatus Nanoarchaeia archaeon]|nr:hypothetical protein [Candidatus Nanoarchaeia archaeon]